MQTYFGNSEHPLLRGERLGGRLGVGSRAAWAAKVAQAWAEEP